MLHTRKKNKARKEENDELKEELSLLKVTVQAVTARSIGAKPDTKKQNRKRHKKACRKIKRKKRMEGGKEQAGWRRGLRI
ncbi:MAG: hypothetical protein QW136_09275 [Nitrososphaerales archaeon]